MRKFNYLIYMGRFQPPHVGHIATITKALELSDYVIVMCGSAFQPRSCKNPFTVNERWDMIKAAVPEKDRNRVICTFSYDYYLDQKWATEVQNRIKSFAFNPKATIGIIGCKKDASSYYLDMFPQWELVEMEHINLINATDIRNVFYEGWNSNSVNDFMKKASSISVNLHESTIKWLDDFRKTEEFSLLKREHEFLVKYKEAWKAAPYAPIFVTTDAVVVCSGHVLMIKRKGFPGEGDYALPGGFLGQDEKLIDGMLRELKEETKIKVPLPVLKGSIKGMNVFDSPYRSQRGRTITHAYFIELVSGELPKVKGGDDAANAFWIPLADVDGLRDHIYEDHANIIDFFVPCVNIN